MRDRGGGCRRGPGPRRWRRDWQGIARWPAVAARPAAGLSVVAGFAPWCAARCARACSSSPASRSYLAALDAAEGLAQEIDHPERPVGYPLPWGTLICAISWCRHGARRHRAPRSRSSSGSAAGVSVLAIAAMLLVPGAIVGAVAAGMALVLGSPPPSTYLGFGFPEIAGFLLAFRIAFPPALMIGAVAATRGRRARGR